MTISYRELRTFTCQKCGTMVHSDVWRILDAQEQPMQTHALLEGQFHSATCTTCGSALPLTAPLLFHHAAQRHVVLAIPSTMPDYVWHEEARHLHSLFMERITPEQQLPYLFDVHITQDIAGLTHVLQKQHRKRTHETAVQNTSSLLHNPLHIALPERELLYESNSPSAAPSRIHELPTNHMALPYHQVTANASLDDITASLQALAAAQSHDESIAVCRLHPVLLQPATDAVLQQLLSLAYEQRDYETATSLHAVRLLLRDVRHMHTHRVDEIHPIQHTEPQELFYETTAKNDSEAFRTLPVEVCCQLLATTNRNDLATLLATNPLLQEDWGNVLIEITIEELLAEGNERLALFVEHRREAIIVFRQTIEDIL